MSPGRLRLLTLAMYLPIVAILVAVLPQAHDLQSLPEAIVVMLIVLTIYITGMGLLVHVSMTSRIEIDRDRGVVSHIYSLCGRTLRRAERPLAAFDKVSLHRAYRGGYITALVGHESEFILRSTRDLKVARQRAEDAASYCALPLKDQI
jgi:hypothetical protein